MAAFLSWLNLSLLKAALPALAKVVGFLLYHWAFTMAIVAGLVAISNAETPVRLVALALTLIGASLWGGKMKFDIAG